MVLFRQSLTDRIKPKTQGSDPNIMIFSPWCYGHHPTYLGHLISYWHKQQLPGILNIVVFSQFFREHADVVEMQAGGDRQSVRFVGMTAEEQANLEAATSGASRAFEQYKLISKYADLLQATKGLVIYFDSCQLALVLGLRLPCPFSGIYYRPTFHYSHFTNSTPTWKERIQHLRERIFLWRLLQHPQLKTLFSLDPLAVEHIARLGDRDRVLPLPDPIKLDLASEHLPGALRDELGIEPDRQIFLSFGRLAEGRKGIYQLVEAVSNLSPDLQRKLCLLFVGEPDAEQMERWLAPIRHLDALQIVSLHGYVPESSVQSYFQLADVVLAPYQKHIGMSGILLQAAAANKPVISSEYGLMGEMVRRYGLGLAVDSTVPREIARAMTRFLLEAPDNLCDRHKMRSFVEQNSVERFADVIFRNI
jgi:glycosyltransferase involved in cell wall biosynthesis